jgi:homoprotocatechuate degradation regulator HpaR
MTGKESERSQLAPYRKSLAGSLLAAREAVMAPIRPHLRKAGVTEQQWRVLRILSDEGPLDSAALSVRALLHAPSVARIIKDLADRALIGREADSTDKRRFILTLTPAGRSLLSATARRTGPVLASFEERFGAERLAALLSELDAFATLGPPGSTR